MSVGKGLGRGGEFFLQAALFVVAAAGIAGAQNGQGYPAQGSAQGDAQGQEDQDPPDRVGRLSYLQGDVSLQAASQDGSAPFAQAELNVTLTGGDRIYTGDNGLAEVQTDSLAVRMGRATDLTLRGLSSQYVQLGLAQGAIRLRTYTLDAGVGIEVDTVNVALTVVRAGDVRIETYLGEGGRPDTTFVTVTAGELQANGGGLNTRIEAGESLRIEGSNPLSVQAVGAPAIDGLDRFDQDRDAQRASAAQAVRDQYVNPAMIGYDDLNTYGDWDASPDYGQVWYPRSVQANWSPYHNGHWAYVSPWGYTWVEAEPWGFAPFHYGRWAQFRGRWGWVPGPPVVRPVYCPALVAFIGGPGFSLTVGGGRGGGLAAWFPLGPREAYSPWYRSSPGYVNRVNVSNLYSRNFVEVRNVYGNRRTNVYGDRGNSNYVNRSAGMVAIPQQAFASGRPVRGAQVRVDARQMQGAEVSSRPPQVAGRPQAMQGLPGARALPRDQGRPNFAARGQEGFPSNRSSQNGGGPPNNARPGYRLAPNQPGEVGGRGDDGRQQRSGPANGQRVEQSSPVVTGPAQTSPVRPPGGMRAPGAGDAGDPTRGPAAQPNFRLAPSQPGSEIRSTTIPDQRGQRPEQAAPPTQASPVRPPGGMRPPFNPELRGNSELQRGPAPGDTGGRDRGQRGQETSRPVNPGVRPAEPGDRTAPFPSPAGSQSTNPFGGPGRRQVEPQNGPARSAPAPQQSRPVAPQSAPPSTAPSRMQAPSRPAPEQSRPANSAPPARPSAPADRSTAPRPQ